jgi:hypothetical protein
LRRPDLIHHRDSATRKRARPPGLFLRVLQALHLVDLACGSAAAAAATAEKTEAGPDRVATAGSACRHSRDPRPGAPPWPASETYRFSPGSFRPLCRCSARLTSSSASGAKRVFRRCQSARSRCFRSACAFRSSFADVFILAERKAACSVPAARAWAVLKDPGPGRLPDPPATAASPRRART